MKVGFIGAGRMGFTLGKHLKLRSSLEVVGYYSQRETSAKEAAEFTDTKYYNNLEELVLDADALFLTVPDGQIAVIVEQLDRLGATLDGKILIHTSGALSSRVFSGISHPVYGYSIHPIYAVNSKWTSYENFDKCFITLEGNSKYLEMLRTVFAEIGHSTKIITADDKVKYHGSAVFASNLVVGLYQMATDLLKQCGFHEEEAKNALDALFMNNAKNIVADGTVAALTGPVARADRQTIMNHMQVLEGDYLKAYKAISNCLIPVAIRQAMSNHPSSEEEDVKEVYAKLQQLFND